MAGEKGFLVGKDWLRLVKDVASAVRDQLLNTPNRPHVPDDIPQAPETYIAYTPNGIPALFQEFGTGTGSFATSGDIPGQDECTIYQAVVEPTGNLGLGRVVGLKKTVLNVGQVAVPKETFFLATRDKFRRWHAISAGGGGSTAISPCLGITKTITDSAFRTDCIAGMNIRYLREQVYNYVCGVLFGHSDTNFLFDSLQGCCDCPPGTGTGTMVANCPCGPTGTQTVWCVTFPGVAPGAWPDCKLFQTLLPLTNYGANSCTWIALNTGASPCGAAGASGGFGNSSLVSPMYMAMFWTPGQGLILNVGAESGDYITYTKPGGPSWNCNTAILNMTKDAELHCSGWPPSITVTKTTCASCEVCSQCYTVQLSGFTNNPTTACGNCQDLNTIPITITQVYGPVGWWFGRGPARTGAPSDCRDAFVAMRRWCTASGKIRYYVGVWFPSGNLGNSPDLLYESAEIAVGQCANPITVNFVNHCTLSNLCLNVTPPASLTLNPISCPAGCTQTRTSLITGSKNASGSTTLTITVPGTVPAGTLLSVKVGTSVVGSGLGVLSATFDGGAMTEDNTGTLEIVGSTSCQVHQFSYIVPSGKTNKDVVITRTLTGPSAGNAQLILATVSYISSLASNAYDSPAAKVGGGKGTSVDTGLGAATATTCEVSEAAVMNMGATATGALNGFTLGQVVTGNLGGHSFELSDCYQFVSAPTALDFAESTSALPAAWSATQSPYK